MMACLNLFESSVNPEGIQTRSLSYERHQLLAYEKADKKVQDDSDRFDYTKGIITMVVVDVSEYRKKWEFENSRFHTKKMKGFSV